MNVLAIDLGGSRIKVGYIKSGKIACCFSVGVTDNKSLANILPKIKIQLQALLTPNEISSIALVAFAYPGLVNFKQKKAIMGNGKYNDASTINLRKWVSENFNCDYIIENDANAALLGETSYGCAGGAKDAVMLILGTGVGTAALMNGNLIRGKHFQAGCLGGHFPVELDGRKCSCGGQGCVEANASTWAISELVKAHPLY